MPGEESFATPFEGNLNGCLWSIPNDSVREMHVFLGHSVAETVLPASKLPALRYNLVSPSPLLH